MKSTIGDMLLRVICGIIIGLAIEFASMQASAQNPPITGVAVGTGTAYAGELVLSNKTTQRFLPRGFTSVGVLYPSSLIQAGMPCSLGSSTVQDLTAAQDQITAANLSGYSYNADIQAMITDWHINTIRFQVSQGGLLWGAANSNATYATMVQSVVAKARAAGLVVILSMQTEAESCTPDEGSTLQKLPDENTEQAWAALLDSTIAGDPGVVLEVFNEPATQVACSLQSTDVYNWGYWAYGCGADQNQGMLPVANYIRTTLNAPNMLLFDADNVAGGFLPDSVTGDAFNPASYTTPYDIPSNSAYTVHPYYYILGTSDWNSRWGKFESNPSDDPNPDGVQHAVVVTEWNVGSNCPSGDDPSLTTAKTLVNTYLPGLNVGLLGFAWDAPITQGGFLVQSYPFSYDGDNYTVTYAAVDPNQFQEKNGVKDPCYSSGASLLYKKFWTQN